MLYHSFVFLFFIFYLWKAKVNFCSLTRYILKPTFNVKNPKPLRKDMQRSTRRKSRQIRNDKDYLHQRKLKSSFHHWPHESF